MSSLWPPDDIPDTSFPSRVNKFFLLATLFSPQIGQHQLLQMLFGQLGNVGIFPNFE